MAQEIYVVLDSDRNVQAAYKKRSHAETHATHTGDWVRECELRSTVPKSLEPGYDGELEITRDGFHVTRDESLEVIPASHKGVDWGADGKVLAENKTTGQILVWHGGHTGWCSVGETSYYPAFLNVRGGGSQLGTDLCKGGRLTRARLAEHADEIAKHLSIPQDLVQYILTTQTTYFEEEA